MDKSFNDDELSDIMKEIEALEEDFSSESKTDGPLLSELAELDEEISIPKTTAQVVSLDSSRSAAKSQAPASMSFKVQGDLSLDLQFDIGGKSVSLEVSSEGLTIVMDGGMKFTVPVDSNQQIKKAG